MSNPLNTTYEILNENGETVIKQELDIHSRSHRCELLNSVGNNVLFMLHHKRSVRLTGKINITLTPVHDDRSVGYEISGDVNDEVWGTLHGCFSYNPKSRRGLKQLTAHQDRVDGRVDPGIMDDIRTALHAIFADEVGEMGNTQKAVSITNSVKTMVL